MDNPYIYKTPVAGRAGFFNQTAEIFRIASRIAADRPQSVSIVGGPRTGKTSMLNYLCDPETRAEQLDEPELYLYLRLDLRGNPPNSPEEFFSMLGAQLEAAGEPAMQASYDGFSDLVEQLMEAGRKLVLLCDDFGLVTQHQGFPLDFFSFMRSLANSNDVGYIMTSDDALQKLCHTQDIGDSPFFNIFTTANLGAFDQEQACQLAAAPAAAAEVPFAAETDWIVDLAGGSPYLLQLTAHWAFAARAAGSLDRARLQEEAFKAARPHLEQLWKSHITEVQQGVLRALCEGGAVDRRQQYAAESLVDLGYVCREGETFAVRGGLLGRFIGAQSGGFWKKLFGRTAS